MNPGLALFLMALRIGITIYCVNRAAALNRDKTSWGLFGFFLPLLAAIWISCLNPNRVWDSNPIDDIKPETANNKDPRIS